MEIVNWNIKQNLKTQGWNQTTKEVTKQLESLSAVLSQVYDGQNIEIFINPIIEECFDLKAPRSIRQVAYTILRAVSDYPSIDWPSLTQPLASDLVLASDPEFQVLALKMLYVIPYSELLYIFTAQETFFNNCIRGENGREIQVAFLSEIPGIIAKVWCGLEAENLHVQDATREIFSYIGKLILSSDDSLCVLSLMAFKTISDESEFGSIRLASQEFEANGTNQELLKPLITYISAQVETDIEMIINRVSALDMAYREPVVCSLGKLLLLVGKKVYIKDYVSSVIFPMVSHIEGSIVWEACRSLSFLPHDPTIAWEGVTRLVSLKVSPSSLLLSLYFLPSFSSSQQLSLSLKILELSLRVKNRVDRLTIILSCLDILVKLSLKESQIYNLFSQGWFVEIWNQPESNENREEIVACLVQACIIHKNNSHEWLVVAFEISDICCKVLDWTAGMEDRTYAPSYYFSLLEEICALGKEEFRLQQLLSELIARFEGDVDTGSISNQFTRNLALLILSRYWQPASEQDLNSIVANIRLRLFSSEMLGLMREVSVLSAKSSEYLLSSLFHFSCRYGKQIGETVIGILEQFIEIIEQSNSSFAVLDLASKILSVIQSAQAVSTDEFSLLLERKNESFKETNADSIFSDCLDTSINIFLSQGIKLPTMISNQPMQVLRRLENPKDCNWRLKSLTSISGIADPVCVQCTDVLYPNE